jgi:hypothetical protein
MPAVITVIVTVIAIVMVITVITVMLIKCFLIYRFRNKNVIHSPFMESEDGIPNFT